MIAANWLFSVVPTTIAGVWSAKLEACNCILHLTLLSIRAFADCFAVRRQVAVQVSGVYEAGSRNWATEDGSRPRVARWYSWYCSCLSSKFNLDTGSWPWASMFFPWLHGLLPNTPASSHVPKTCGQIAKLATVNYPCKLHSRIHG